LNYLLRSIDVGKFLQCFDLCLHQVSVLLFSENTTTNVTVDKINDALADVIGMPPTSSPITVFMSSRLCDLDAISKYLLLDAVQRSNNVKYLENSTIRYVWIPYHTIRYDSIRATLHGTIKSVVIILTTMPFVRSLARSPSSARCFARHMASNSLTCERYSTLVASG